MPFTIPSGTHTAGVTTGCTTDLNNLYAAATSLTAYNVLSSIYSGGAAGNGTTDDTAAVQAAINAAQTAGGATVYLPVGTYLVSGLTITASDVTLYGDGIGATIIKLKNSANADVIAVSGTGTVNVHIENLSVDGNKANQTTAGNGISINTPYSSVDTQHRIANVDLINTFGDGINITGDTRVVRMMHVRAKQANGSGYNLSGSDHQVFSCVADSNSHHGFVVFAGDPTFIGCKAFFNDSAVGGYAGFRVEGTGCYFSACEAQNNNENGWVIIGTASGVILDGCAGTSNGTNFAGAGSGVQIASVSGVSVTGGLFTEIPGGKQVYGISLTGTTTNVRASGFTASGNVTAPYNDASSGSNFFGMISKTAAGGAVTDTANTIASLGSLNVPALDVTAGTRYVIKAAGTLSTAATPGTFTADLRWGGTGGTLITSVVSGTDTAALTASLTTQPVLIEAEVTFVTATTCTAWMRVTWRNSNTATTAPVVALKAITSAVTVTTSSAQALSLDWTWSVTGDSITVGSPSFDRAA